VAFHVERRRRSPGAPRCPPEVPDTRCYGHLVVTDTSFRETPLGLGARRSRLRRGLSIVSGGRTEATTENSPPHQGASQGRGRDLVPRSVPALVRVRRAAPLRGARSSCPVPPSRCVPATRHLVADTSRQTLVASAPISPDAARSPSGARARPPASPGEPCDFARQAGPTVLRRTTPLVFRSESWQRSSLFGGVARDAPGREQTTRRRHDSFVATCSVRLRPPRAPLWETWGKHRASGFPKWFQRVPSGSFRRACGETSDFWNAAGGEPRARAASHPRPG
jgi:hypothetical protein